ncbi:hypothetical protein OHA61_16550 [Streptomyces sp. NBC_00885]|uniref:hypothetical protein n=1 Tax=Streptomyces sp. NBC_00885 TaxID=2975857 RepID=UPI0038662C69|nr:hypothetical protein OHA61_16550 [Streptomyces sp. NBC_00885]
MTDQHELLSDAYGPELAQDLGSGCLEREMGVPFRRELPMAEVIRQAGTAA